MSKPASGWRLRLFRLLAPVLAPLLVFGIAEGALRLGGYGYPTSFFLPRAINGQKAWIENNRVGWRYFGAALARRPYPVAIPAEKPKGTIRVFVFGESAAYGDPDPDFGLPRMLQTLLRERYPGTRFEVVNMAMLAINSNVLLPFARECAGKEGDIWVIYMGNNEVVGPYGGGTVFGSQAASLPVIRSSLALKSTRTGQLLNKVLGNLQGSGRPSEWRGMAMFVRNQVRRDDPRMAVVYSHFRRNLKDMLQVGVSHRVGIVLSTVAVNLRDCPPFASLHRPGLAEAQIQEWERIYRSAIEAEQGGKQAEAVGLYQKAAQLDDQFAELQFRWARCCLALGREDEAQRRFALARDLDGLRFRADSRINDIIRQAAQGREKEHIIFADAEKAFAAQSPHSLPGKELLYEHVHLTFDGNYVLAKTVADQVERLLPGEVKRRADSQPGWLSLAECKREMGWSDWEQLEALQHLRIDGPPFTYQLDHSSQVTNLQEWSKSLVTAASPEALQDDAGNYERLVTKVPDDWVFLCHLARLQQRMGNFAASMQTWLKITKLLPHQGDAFLQVGMILMRQNRRDDAIKYFETGMELDPRSAQAGFVNLLNDAASQLADQRNYKAAAQLYRQALDFKPDAAEVQINLGIALLAIGNRDEAREQFNSALQHPPAVPESLKILGQACYDQGWLAEAIKGFEEALKLNEDDAMAHFQLGEALAAANRPAEARQHYAEALRLKSDLSDARLRLGK